MERMTSPNIENRKTAILEKTLALIKPDGMQYREDILKRILKAGFAILQSRVVKLTPEEASEFYKSKSDFPKYPLMVITLTEGPIMAMCISKLAAIKEWKALMGPEAYDEANYYWPGCLRAKFADPNDEFKNAVHGSENANSAKYELKFFFPHLIIEPILNPEEYRNYLQAYINPIVMEGLYLITKIKPQQPIEWLAEWLYLHNPNKPEIYNTNENILNKIEQLRENETKLKSSDTQQQIDSDVKCSCGTDETSIKMNGPKNSCSLPINDESLELSSCELLDDGACRVCKKPIVSNDKNEFNSQDSFCDCALTSTNNKQAGDSKQETVI